MYNITEPPPPPPPTPKSVAIRLEISNYAARWPQLTGENYNSALLYSFDGSSDTNIEN